MHCAAAHALLLLPFNKIKDGSLSLLKSSLSSSSSVVCPAAGKAALEPMMVVLLL